MNPNMIWTAYSILRLSLCPVGCPPPKYIGGRISSDWREVCCSAPVGLSMGGTYYMGAGGPGQLVDLPMGGLSYKDTGGQVKLVDL